MSADYNQRVIPILPRIHKPGEQYPYRQIAAGGGGPVMIASWADLEWSLASGFEVWADYSLNIFNRYSLSYLTQRGVSGYA